jgi:hypothetical protein
MDAHSARINDNSWPFLVINGYPQRSAQRKPKQETPAKIAATQQDVYGGPAIRSIPSLRSLNLRQISRLQNKSLFSSKRLAKGCEFFTFYCYLCNVELALLPFAPREAVRF